MEVSADDDFSPVYFTVVVDTSTSRAGMINSICGGLGMSLGSLIAGQSVSDPHSPSPVVRVLISGVGISGMEASINYSVHSPYSHRYSEPL